MLQFPQFIYFQAYILWFYIIMEYFRFTFDDKFISELFK